MYINQNFGKIIIEGVLYQKFEKLGEGTEGIVYKGENIQTKQKVAIKEYKKINRNEQIAIEQIRQKNFSHIIGIKGLQNNLNKCPIIIMEFADGEFYKFMQTNDYARLNYQERNQYFLQMVQGVSQLHQLELFHRDLKPENFVYIIQADKQKIKIIKLIDFGLVKENANKLAKTSGVGTPFYIAPEVLQSNSNQSTFYDKSVDIWSLGIIWYEILVGETFFNGKSIQDILSSILNKSQEEIDKQIQYNPIIQQKEKDLMKEMLKRNSIQRLKLEKRYQSYNQLQTQDQQKNYNQKIQVQFNQVQLQFNQISSPQQQILTGSQQPQLESQENKRLIKEIDELNNKLKRIQEETQKTMKDDYEQKLRDFELKKEGEIKQMKKQIEKEKDQELSEKLEQVKNIQKNEFELKIKEKEKELKMEQENVLKQQQDKEKLEQMKFQQEIEFQNEMDKFKKSKEQEQNLYLQQFLQKENKTKEEEIKKILQEQEKQVKKQLELEIQKKYMLEYSKKVSELVNQQQQENLQQLEDKKQSLQILLQSYQNTIKNFIQNLEQKLQNIKNIDLLDDKKDKLIQYITSQLQNNTVKFKKNELKQQQIQQVYKKEQLRGFDSQLALELQQDIQDFNNVNQMISEQLVILQKQVGDKQRLEQQKKEQQKLQTQEQQLNKEKQYYKNIFLNLKQQSDSHFVIISKIQERMYFYDRIQYQIKEQEKFQQLIGHYSKLTQELLVLEQQEKTITQFEKSQQLINYQSFKSKLEELLLAQNQMRILIEEINNQFEQIDSTFIDENQRQIDALTEDLFDYQDKFKYLSQNKKYDEKINLINSQIRDCSIQLKNLNLILKQDIFQNYQKIKKTFEAISQYLQELQNQYNLFLEQVHNDQQIESINAERIKKLKVIEGQLNDFINKMNHLKIQISDISKNQFCNNEARTLIMDKQYKIDLNIFSIQKQYLNFQQFNQLTSCEAINIQIIYLEQFQEKLSQQLLNEQDNVNQLYLVIQKISNDKREQDREYFQLKNQLQQTYNLFTKAFFSVKIDSDKIAYLEQINEKRQELQKQLEQEIETIDDYYEINKNNQKLIEELISIMKGKLQKFYNNIPVLLYKLQDHNQKKTLKLIEVQQIVHNKQHELNFLPLDDTVINTYKYLYQQEELISQQITEINQMEQNQKQNPQLIFELKEKMQTLINQLNELIQKIPQNDQVQQFNGIYKNNLESYERLYALINYIKQYHLTRYYERIKENNNYTNQYKKNLIESQKGSEFQNKQNQGMEENITKENQAQNLLKIYENILFHQYNKKMIEELQKDFEQISTEIKLIENQIKQKNLVKLRGSIKNSNNIDEIIKYYKISELAQIQQLNIIRKTN